MLWPKKKDAEHERMGDGRGGRGAWAHGLLPPPTRGQRASQVALVIKNLPANAGDVRGAGSIPGSGKSPGEGNGSPLQYSCLEDPMDRGDWWATVCACVCAKSLQLCPTLCNLVDYGLPGFYVLGIL